MTRFPIPQPALVALLASAAHADLVITEVMPLSAHANTAVNGDWWELTNTGTTSVNLSGYKWDDAPTPEAPTVGLFPNLTILAGESIIILEEAVENVAAWKAAWGLPAAARVVNRDQFTAMGGEGFSGLNGPNGDEVNLYDPSGALAAHVSFGPTSSGRSRAFHRDRTPIYGLLSVAGKHGAKNSTQIPADTASPGNTTIHFTSAPLMYGLGNYAYRATTSTASRR
ncbi:MAG: lamin tail domain-containing protein [Verrucomicrobia bacterium]|nr:lamin tail domain-containing protein [Verrucomicrobiota bacterium]MDA1006819.1 lamin tail domain-containing protein [Verrucomicrobiota bacterium]